VDLGRVAVVGVECQHLVDSEVFTECPRKRRQKFWLNKSGFSLEKDPEGVDCASPAPKPSSAVHAGLALVLTGERDGVCLKLAVALFHSTG